MLFFKASKEQASAIKSVLETFNNISGQWVNQSILQVFFSPNTPHSIIRDVCDSVVSLVLKTLVSI